MKKRVTSLLLGVFVVLIAVGVPYFSIIATSIIKLRGYGLAAGNFTLDHYKELLTTPKALASIGKSLFLAVSSATICSVIGTAVVAAVRKSKGFFKKALGGVSLLPEMPPMISRGIFAGWMMIFIIAFRELVTASLIAPPNTLVVSTYINREFEQGSISLGMAMAVLCVLITTTALLIFNRIAGKSKAA